jgi:hypothetical protein
MLKIKQGVRVLGLKPEALLGIVICSSVFNDHNLDCVLTSVVDGKHSRASKHYSGYAWDLRTRNIPTKTAVDKIFLAVKSALGADYDVVLESNHIHCEFDPKDPL